MNKRDKDFLDQCKIESKNAFGEVIEIGFDAEKFADLIRADEREACAKVVEPVDLFSGDFLKNSDSRITCAQLIRAKGNT